MEGLYRIDILSDLHGHLSTKAYEALEGADLIVVAGDICSSVVFDELETIGPEVIGVLGNNDHVDQYGPRVKYEARFSRKGLTFKVAHIPRDLLPYDTDIAICGHTHVPLIEKVGATLVINPGSVTRPRTSQGPTMARLLLGEGYVASYKILSLGL